MQINSLGGVPAYNSYLPKLVKTVKNIPEPKFSNTLQVAGVIFFTKTEATRSDEEIKNDVIALAKKHAQDPEVKERNGHLSACMDTPSQQKQEYDTLLFEYVSPYSPDRKAIFAKGVDSSLNEIKSRISKPIIDMTIFELLLFGKNTVKTNFWYGSNGKSFDVTELAFFENGERIGQYCNQLGWTSSLTDAELARELEIKEIYFNAFKAESKNTAKTAATAFDFAAHNVSNQQNQTAQNTPAQQAVSRYEQIQHAEHKK